MRLIDADELIVMEYGGIKFVPIEFINDAPAIEERKKGKWYAIGNSCLATCECGYFTDRYSVYNFCPCCGAYMRGEDDADE